VYGAVVCSYDAVSLFYLELYVKLSIYLSISTKAVLQQCRQNLYKFSSSIIPAELRHDQDMKRDEVLLPFALLAKRGR
jgi:hypothetical protein